MSSKLKKYALTEDAKGAGLKTELHGRVYNLDEITDDEAADLVLAGCQFIVKVEKETTSTAKDKSENKPN
jgi:hypothetical protein